MTQLPFCFIKLKNNSEKTKKILYNEVTEVRCFLKLKGRGTRWDCLIKSTATYAGRR